MMQDALSGEVEASDRRAIRGGRAVRYSTFSRMTADGFARFVEDRRRHPVKVLALDWLDRDELLPPRFSLLDVGCGPGVFARVRRDYPRLRDRVVYTGVDQSENAPSYATAAVPTGRFLWRDVLAEGLPEGEFDVITIHEVIEYLPDFDAVPGLAAARQPKVWILSSFGVDPEDARKRTMWHAPGECYMNYYPFTEIHRYLRGLAGNRLLYVADLGSSRDERGNPLYPDKTYLLFYVRLGAEPAVPREGPTFPPVVQPWDTRRGT